jgi:hypothetical protein
MANRWSPEGALAHVLRTVLLAMLLPLASCATAYQPEQRTGGYTDFRLAANTYRVRFRGNNYTPRDKVELFLLYRCAQLTEHLGYEHFVVLSEDTLDISDPFAQAGIFPRNYYATALIQVIDDRAHPTAYDAKALMRQLRAQYPHELGS